MISLLELHLEHPVQWLIYMVHFNELALRHLFMHLDVTTFGPTAFTGVLGTSIARCHVQPVLNFKARPNVLPSGFNDTNTLYISKDQKYISDICKAVQKGQV